MKTALILITAACLTAVGSAAQADISGITADCVGGKHLSPAGVDVYAFDAAKVPELLNLLKTLATDEPNPNDSRSVQSFFQRYDRLAQLIKTSPKLAHGKTDKSGRFKLTPTGQHRGSGRGRLRRVPRWAAQLRLRNCVGGHPPGPVPRSRLYARALWEAVRGSISFGFLPRTGPALDVWR